MATIEERYREMFSNSVEWYERGRSLFAGGITHQTRFTSPFPAYIDYADGPYKYDVDDNQIIDYVMGNGSLLMGHTKPEIIEAVTKPSRQRHSRRRRFHPRSALCGSRQAPSAVAGAHSLHGVRHRVHIPRPKARPRLHRQDEDCQVPRAFPRLARLRNARIRTGAGRRPAGSFGLRDSSSR